MSDEEVLASLEGFEDLDDGLVATLMSQSQQMALCRRAGIIQSIAAELTRTQVQEYARLIVVDLAAQVRALRDLVK